MMAKNFSSIKKINQNEYKKENDFKKKKKDAEIYLFKRKIKSLQMCF